MICNLWILKSHSIRADVNNISFKQTVNNYKLKNSGNSIHIIDDDFLNRKVENGKLEPED